MQKVVNLLEEYKWPLAIIVIGRLGLFVLAFAGLALIRDYDSGRTTWELFGENRWLNGWVRWDAGWYKDIAELGYAITPRFNEQRNVVFFPLYPLLIGAVRTVTRHTGMAGLIVSNLSFVVALLLLYRLTLRHYGQEIAKATLILVSVYPFSFYYSAMYSEALFFVLTVAAFSFGHRSQWLLAALMAALASATRFVGVTLGLALLLLYLEGIEYQIKRIRINVLWLALSPMGFVAYLVYLAYAFDNPLIFATGRYVEGWEANSLESFQSALTTISRANLLTGDFMLIDLGGLGLTLLMVASVVMKRRELPLAYVAWTIVYVLVAGLGGWHNLGRYILPVFPIYLALALILKRQEALFAVVYLSTLALALLTILYTHWYWVT